MKKHSNKTEAALLRQKAEEQLQKKAVKTVSKLSESDALKLVHELEVHQIELEMQQDELILANERAEKLAANKYAELYDFAPTGYFTLSNDGKIIELNLAASQMLGKERVFLVRSRYSFFVSDDTKPFFNTFLEKVFHSKTKQSCEVALTTNGNAPLYVHLTGIVSENGSQCYITAVDITRLMQTEETLKASETKYRLLYESNQMPIAIFDAETLKFLSVNNAFVHKYGYTREEFSTMTILEIRPDAEIERVKQSVKMIDKGLVNLGEYLHKKKNGEIIHVEIIRYDLVFEGKNAKLVFANDITERRRSEEELRAKEAQYHQMFEGNLAIKLLIDPQTTAIIDSNQAALDFYGYPKEKLLQMRISEINTLTENEIKKEMQSAVDGNRKYFVFKHRIANGEIRDVEVYSSPINVKGNNLLYSIVHDITERKRAEEDLRKSKEAFQGYFEMGSIGMCITSPEKGWIEVNDRLCQMLGYNKNELSQLTWAELTYSEDLNADLELFNETVEGKRNSYQLDKRFVRKDGNIIYTTLSVSCLRKTDGTVDHFLASLLDITERKSVEQALAVSTNQLERTSEVAKVGGWELDLTTMQMSFSKESLRINEIDPNSQMTLELAINMISPKARPIMQIAVQAAIDNGQPFDLELPLITAKGKYIWTHTKGYAVMVGDKAVKVVGTFQDITEHKQAEELLKESEFKYRALIENSNDSIFCVDKEGYYKFVNKVFASTFGKIPEYFYGKSFWDIYSKEQADMRFAASSKVFETGKAGSVDVEVPLPDRLLYFIAKTNPIRDPQGNVILNLTIATDITERKKVEEELRESEDKYRGVVENSPNAIAIYVDGKIVFVNNQCVLLMGAVNKEELIGKSVIQFVHPDNRAMVIARMQQAAIDGKPLPTAEEKFIRLDGTSVDVEVRAVPTNYKQKPAVQLIVQDITERKIAEESLRLSEQTYRGILDSITEAVYVEDANGIFLDVNRAAEKMYGYTKEEFVGRTPEFLSAPGKNDLSQLAPLLEKALNGEPQYFEFWGRRKDGTIFPKDVSNSLGYYFGKKVNIAVARDITERKQAEMQLHSTKERLHLATSSAKSGVWDWNLQTNEMIWDDRMRELYGLSLENFSGGIDSWEKGLHPEDASRAVEECQQAIRGEREFDTEFRIMRPNGEVVHIKANGLVIRDQNGKPVRMIGMNTDITERKNNEQALRQAQKLESIGTLAGGIAHDFNNLMNAVLGQSALALQKLPKESPAANNIQKAIKAGERVADLTKQLLAYSGRGRFVIDEIDLNKLVKENVAMLEVSIPKTTQLRYELGNPSPHIMGDISQIQQVIMNLIINAGEAMGSHPGFITIHTNRIELPENNSAYSKYSVTPIAAGSYAMLQVKDNGSGISEETLARIFDPFFTTKFTGRGLGLAAVLGIIKGHKGGLRIESEVGKGTMFEIIWPLVEASTISNITEKKEIEVNGEGKTILVIDDEFTVIELVNDVLSESNFKVMSALDPIKGIDLYRQHHQTITMVVLDYSMPHMDGKAAFEKLLQINKEVKVLLCSGYTEEETMSVFGIDRPTGFFHKPYMPDALLERVGEIIAKK